MGYGIIILLASFYSVASSSALQCYHCRLNVCDHPHCASAMAQLNPENPRDENYVGVQDWSTIQNCPSKLQNSSNVTQPTQPEFAQTCKSNDYTCGQLIYHITTKSVANIVSNHSESVPVIASGSDSFKSAIVVLGCIPRPPSHNCKTGFKKMAEAAGVNNTTDSSTTTISPTTNSNTISPTQVNATSGNDSSSSNQTKRAVESKLTNLEHINDITNCCHCEKDLCNVAPANISADPQPIQCTNVMHITTLNNQANAGAAFKIQNLFLTLVISVLFGIY